MTKSETDENEFIVSLGCLVCGASPQIHHNRRNGGKRNKAPKVPLCFACHDANSPSGLHHIGVKAFEREHGSVNSMAAWVEEQMKERGMVPTWRKK